MLKILGLCSSILLLAVGSAHALDNVYADPGGYLAVEGVFASGQGIERLDELKDSGGVAARAGYRMARYASIEVQGTYVPTLGKQAKNTWDATIGFRFYYPVLNDRLQPFIVMSGGVMSSGIKPEGASKRKTRTGGSFRGGAGIDFYITDNLALTSSAQYVSGTGRVDNLNYIYTGLGVQYKWGGPE